MTVEDSHPQIEPATQHQELKVIFYPPLVLQRRIWILDILRAEQVTEVLDIGCGEGQLLSVLCQPAPWQPPPPPNILPVDHLPQSPYIEKIPNLHPKRLHGLDVCSEDLAFAIEGTSPPKVPNTPDRWPYTSTLDLRWEQLEVKLWHGGLEQINEEFVGVQCIVSTEVIEHLPPDIFPAFAPMLLGVYHPDLVLITTPSYTFNTRFTAPSAPPEARQGFLDPTNRTDRIFRHPDHKFEWTLAEFEEWCTAMARDWGYKVEISSIGRAQEADEWGRDDDLGGATQVALFKRLEMDGREAKARDQVKLLKSPSQPQTLLVQHSHTAHYTAGNPQTLEEIACCVKTTMEEVREEIMRIEQLWFERKVAEACGGWIELLVAAVESCEYLALIKGPEGTMNERGSWTVELLGGFSKRNEPGRSEREASSEKVLWHWYPEEDCVMDSSEDDCNQYTDIEGDISRDASDVEETHGAGVNRWTDIGWGQSEFQSGENTSIYGGWPKTQSSEWNTQEKGDVRHKIRSSTSSTTGWEGDESEDDIWVSVAKTNKSSTTV